MIVCVLVTDPDIIGGWVEPFCKGWSSGRVFAGCWCGRGDSWSCIARFICITIIIVIGCSTSVGVAAVVTDTEFMELGCNASMYHNTVTDCSRSVGVASIVTDPDLTELDCNASFMTRCFDWLMQVCGRGGDRHRLHRAGFQRMWHERGQPWAVLPVRHSPLSENHGGEAAVFVCVWTARSVLCFSFASAFSLVRVSR